MFMLCLLPHKVQLYNTRYSLDVSEDGQKLDLQLAKVVQGMCAKALQDLLDKSKVTKALTPSKSSF